MVIVSFIILAIGLSMDSLAVALTSGAILKHYTKINVIKIAGMLACMQMLLTIAGWLAGHSFATYIHQYDHWIAFGILFLLGAKAIYEGLKKGTNENPAFNPLDIKVMFGLAVATSIDAIAIGLSLSLLQQPVLLPSIIIGAVTFVMASAGTICGCKVGQKYNHRINFVGGLILIIIGSSILANHTIWQEDYATILQNINIAGL